MLSEFALMNGLPDPENVTVHSTNLILNLLYQYSGLNQSDESKVKGVYAVNGMIIALRWIYHEAGHGTTWSVQVNVDGDMEACGNPLQGNMYIAEFRKMYVRKLSSLCRIPKSAHPITTEHVVEYGRKYLLASHTDPRDVLNHAFLLTGMNCGMRFDELSKVKFDSFKCTKHGVSFSIEERTKNEFKRRDYDLRRRPGEKLSRSLLMDPIFALTLWALTRGDSSGYLYYNITGVTMLQLDHQKPWGRSYFTDFLHNRLLSIGILPSDVKCITVHSLERGGVQLLRFLGVKDQSIMRRFNMTGEVSYVRYTELCNRKRLKEVPDFSSLSALNAHASISKSLDEKMDEDYYVDVADWLFA